MKKFRLQSILEYRKSLEEEIQREFLEIQKTLEAEMELSSEIQGQMAACQQKLQQKLREEQPEDISQIDLHHKFLRSLMARAEKQKGKVHSLELAVEKKRQALLEAGQEKKVMERLKEKTLLLQEKKMLQEEQKMLDEIIRIQDES